MTREEADVLRERLLEASLGQVDAAGLARLEQQLEACAGAERLRLEWTEIQDLVRVLRAARAVRPSARFRRALEERLDDLDAGKTDERTLARRVLHGARFQWECLVLRLEISRALRWKLTAALAVIGAGVAWASMRSWSPPSVSATPEIAAQPPAKDQTERDGMQQDPPPPAATVETLREFEPSFVDEPPKEPTETPVIEPLLEDSSRPELAADALPQKPLPQKPLPHQPLSIPMEWQSLQLEAGKPNPSIKSARWERPGVLAGLRWLISQQRKDGSFTAGAGDADLGTAVTALAALALNSGLKQAPTALHRVEVERAVAAAAQHLLALQDSTGTIGRVRDPAASLFNHATAALFLTEWVAERPADELREQRRKVAHGLDALELGFDSLLAATARSGADRELQRCLGHNASICALALETAARFPDLWVQSADTPKKVENLLELLKTERSMLLATRAVLATYRHGTPLDPRDAWAEVVSEVVRKPGEVDPTLLFLVSTALCPRSDVESPRWMEFRERVHAELLASQVQARGYFRPRRRWDCFDGGAVGDTALSLLILEVESRAHPPR